MTWVEALLIFLAVIGVYALIVLILHKKGILEKYNISFYGPALMWRTKRGRTFLKRIASKDRFWHAYGNAGVVLCFIFMIGMVALLAWQTWSLLDFTPEQIENLPGLEVALVIPGINPILPLEYIGFVILALVVAMIVHEFSHGILTYASKLKVKSLGILYAIVPLGAFCEPDEEELKETDAGKRMRIYAAGPTSNFIVVAITLVLFSFVFMSAVAPVSDGVIVFSVSEDSPAADAGLHQGVIITEVNQSQINNVSTLLQSFSMLNPNQTVSLSYLENKQEIVTEITVGDLYYESIKRGLTVNSSVKGDIYIGAAFLNDEVYRKYLTSLQNPFEEFPLGFGLLYILPIYGYLEGFNPIAGPFTSTYIITGPLAALPTEVFWTIVNALYWIFWLNFAVAIFNVLPMIPLDGGFLFKDALDQFAKKIISDDSKEKRERVVKQITAAISLVILFIILFPFILKYVIALF